MPVIYLIHGFIGAGKTTFSKRFEREKNAVRYSPDEWMVARHGANPPGHLFSDYLMEIKHDILSDAREELNRGRDVIFDYGFWKRAERDAYRAIAKEWNAPFQMLWIKACDAVMEQRVLARTKEMPDGQLFIDKNAIEEFRNRFEPLQVDEAYKVIEN